MIYFIGNREMNICKIGYSKRPYRRIESIKKTVPFELEIFSIIEGSMSEEKMYHSKYSEFKIKGEWFKLSKVEELGFDAPISVLMVGDIKLNINGKNCYVHVSSLLAQLNRERASNKINLINFNQWVKINKIFLESMENPIIKDSCNWCNIFVAYELIRCSSVKNKIMLYDNLYKLAKI
jgi:hypothetical protein